MRKFSYDKSQATEPEDYFAVRKKQVNRSRIFYLIALWIILLSALVYVVDRMYWVRFTGKFSRTLRYTTFPDDVYVLQINFKEGDHFQVGDTLFWFCSFNHMNMGSAWGRINRDHLLDPVRAMNDVDQKENLLRVLTNRVRELKQELTLVRKQVFLGVATPQDVRKREAEIEDMNIKIELADMEVKTAREFLKTTGDVRLSGNVSGGGVKIDSVFRYALANYDIDLEKVEILPWRAQFDASVFHVNLSSPSICYKGNFVLGLQIDDPALSDIHAIMWSQRYKMHEIKTGDIVEVKIGGKYHKAKVSMKIPTVAELPSYLEKNFEREKVALEYRLDFLYPEQLETWEKTDGIPLTIRAKRNIFKSIQYWFGMEEAVPEKTSILPPPNHKNTNK